MVILWFGDNLLIYLRFAWEFLFTKTDTALLKNTGGIISMVSVTPGIQLGSLLASYRPLILEQELAHHSATGVFSIHTYPHLLNYPVSLIPALEGSQSQLHQLAVCHTGPRKGGTSLRTCLSVLQPLNIRPLPGPGMSSTGTATSLCEWETEVPWLKAMVPVGQGLDSCHWCQ